MNGFIEIPIELSKAKIYFSYTCDTDNEKLGTDYNIDELVANLYGIRRNIMELKYEVTEEDYIKFNIYHAKNSKSHKKTYNMLKYIIPILCGVVIFFTGPSLYKQPKLYWGIISILFILIWIIRFPKTYEKLIRKSAKDMLNDGDNSFMICHNTMIIKGNNIKVISEHSTEITSKEGIKEIKVYEDMILIYLSGFTAHIVPTRYLTEETKEELLKKLEFVKDNNK
ncbi:YcxB family protein [Tissierella praeacuta]|nr:YcxB family protein [Tissierella praeacuta]MBU5255799.1 YcxB family protein [Tissierella praeacuta]